MRLVVAWALLTAVPAAPAAAPGSGFASVAVTSVASGASFVFSSTSQVPAELDVPYAATSVRLGAGQATASVGWPGETGAALGSTLIVGFGAPDQARLLNDPAYARARSGTGPPTVTNTTVPAGTMTAHATTDDTSAQASVDGASALATTIGSARSTSSARLVGTARAVVTGATTVRDVSIAGVVHVGAVVSSATATTDGLRADAGGSTSVSGLTVAGQSVTVDEHGISVAGTGVPAEQALSAVQQALAQAQVTLTLSRPVRTAKGGRVEYATGGLVVSTPLGVVSLGGVQLRAAAALNDPAVAAVVGAASSPVPGPGTYLPAPGTGAGAVVTGADPGPPPATLPPLLRQVLRILTPVSLTTGYGAGWLAVGLLLLLAAAGVLARLPRRWLPTADAGCPLESRLEQDRWEKSP